MSRAVPLATTALSLAAVALSGVALVLVLPDDSDIPGVPSDPRANRVAQLEESLSRLDAELHRLHGRLESVELQAAAAVADRSGPAEIAPGEEESDPETAATRGPSTEESLRAPVEAAVRSVMEEKGVELVRAAQAIAKRERTRDGISNWVWRQRDRLPDLQRRIAERMQLAPPRREQVTEILESTFVNMADLTEMLYADPPPADDEAQVIMGEIKGSVGDMVGELGEVLEPAELIQLGELTVESEMPRLGMVMIEGGKEETSEEAASESAAPSTDGPTGSP